MSPKDFSQRLDGRQYGNVISKEEKREAGDHGLVCVYGLSDDIMMLVGVIHEEIGCYDGTIVYLTDEGLLVNQCDCDDCPYFAGLKKSAIPIRAVWCDGEWEWRYETQIPHETFQVFEDGDKYCLGIVFRLSDVGELIRFKARR